MAHSSSHSERSIHEMLKDAPPMNESNSAIQSGIEGRHPTSLHIRTNSGKMFISYCKQQPNHLLNHGFLVGSSNNTNTSESIIQRWFGNIFEK